MQRRGLRVASVKSQWTAFHSLYSHGFVRIAAAVPNVRIADPAFNAQRTVELARGASDQNAALVVFPELGLSGYAIDDLLHQQSLTDAVLEAIETVVAESAALEPVIVVGAPLEAERGLFNTAVVIHRGRVLGVVPKSYLPEYLEYYEKRQFRAAREAIEGRIALLGEDVPFGPDLLFECTRPAAADACTSRSARTCGCRSRRAPTARWPARPCSRTCRRATSRSARPITGEPCARRIRRGRSPATSTPRPASASRQPTWRGTASRSSARTATWWPSPSASPTPSS